MTSSTGRSAASLPPLPADGLRVIAFGRSAKLAEHCIQPVLAEVTEGETFDRRTVRAGVPRGQPLHPRRSRDRDPHHRGPGAAHRRLQDGPVPLDRRITDLRGFARLGEEGVDLFLTAPPTPTSPASPPPGTHPGHRAGVPHHPAAGDRVQLRRPRPPHPAGPRRRSRPGRKVAFIGRSMVRKMGLATDLGYLRVPDGLVVDAKTTDRLRRTRSP
jgi:ribonuclease J